MPIINRFSLIRQIEVIKQLVMNDLNLDTDIRLKIQSLSFTEQTNIIVSSKLLVEHPDILQLIDESLLKITDFTLNKINASDERLRYNNILTYSLANHLISDALRTSAFLPEYTRHNQKIIMEAILSSYTRLGGADIRENFLDVEMSVNNREIVYASKLFSASELLKDISGNGLNSFFQATSASVRNFSERTILDSPIYEIFDINKYVKAHDKLKHNFKEMGVDVETYPLGNFAVLKYNGIAYIVTYEIMRRASELIEELAKTMLMTPTMDLIGDDGLSFTKKLINEIMIISRYDSEMVGEVIKASRNLLLAELEDSNILGTSMISLLSKEYDETKLKMATRFKEFIRANVRSHRYAIMFSHIYKMSCHPDVDIPKSFEKLQGLYSPNKVDEGIFQYYRGVLRRSLFESLAKGKKNPRLSSGPLMEKTMTSIYNYKLLANASAMAWADCVFAINPALQKFDDVVVKVSNKSSAPSENIKYKDFAKMRSYYNEVTGSRSDINMNIVRKFLSKNDAESSLLDESNLTPSAAREKISQLRKAYNDILNRTGKAPQDLTIADFETSFKESRDNFHIVGTEPKLGEKHKKETRMFYMAEQCIKAYTQRCERLARQISRYQRGVSITKSSASRDRDINSFISSMRFTNTDTDYCFFISFDMSSFSMKFPHELLDDYGEILYQLTGDDIYLNLSIVFKMAVVYNNTRESFEYLPAPKGGFEGFYNFIWTSIHAAILETSLMRTGLAGEVLTYSDDGLLKIYFKDIAGKTPLDVVNTIKETYSMLGLEFNLGKTLVSPIIWEYLGKVCYRGSLIKSYSKELSTLGTEESTRSFNPVSLRLNSYIGQMRACVSAGMPVYSTSIIGTYYIMKMITKINRLVPISTLKYLVIIPESCGGFRIPSSLELSTYGGSSQFIEFMADLSIYSETDSSMTNKIISKIVKGMKNTDIVTLALRKALVAIEGMDNSGRSVMLKIIDEARSKSKIVIPEDPLNDSIRIKLNAILSQVDDIDLEIFGSIIRSAPTVVKYEDIIALTKTQAIFRLISKRKIQSYQSKDTVKVRSNINSWSDILSVKSESEGIISPVLMYEKLDEMCNNKLCIFRPSARIMYTSHDSPFYTITKLEIPRFSMNQANDSDFDFDYTEVFRFTKIRDVDLTWDAEAFGYSDEFFTRQFAYKLINLVTTSKTMWNVAKDIVSVFDVDIVLTYCMNKINKSLYRKRVNKGKNLDISIASVQGYNDCTYIYNSPETYYNIESNPHNDLSTYPTLAKAIFLTFMSYKKPTLGYTRYMKFNFHEKCAPYLISPDRMTAENYKLIMFPIVKPVSMRDYAFETTIADAIDDIMVEDSIAEKLQDFPNIELESHDIYNVFIQDFHIHLLKDYILSSIRESNNRNILSPPKIPLNINLRIKFVAGAIVESVYEIYSPSQLAIIYNELKNMETGDLKESRYIKEFGLDSYINMAIDLMKKVYFGIIPDEIIRTVNDIEYNRGMIHNYIYKRDIFNHEEQLVLMISDSPNSSFSKQSLHSIISRLYKNQLTIITNSLRDTDWSTEHLNEELRELFSDDIDIAYDIFSIVTTILRFSSHRESIMFPFNIRMATVMLLQCWAINNYIEDYGYDDIAKKGGSSFLNTLIPELLGEYDSEGKYVKYTYLVDYAFNMYHKDLYGVIMRESGPDHWYRASETIYPVIIKRCIDRYNQRKSSPFKENATEIYRFALSRIQLFNMIMGSAISDKVVINYVPRAVRDKLIAKGMRIDISDIVIDDSLCEYMPSINFHNPFSDKRTQFECLFAIKLTVMRAIKSGLMVAPSIKYMPDHIKTLLTKVGNGPIDTHFNNPTPNVSNIIVVKKSTLRESLTIYKIMVKSNKGKTCIYKLSDENYVIVSYGLLSSLFDSNVRSFMKILKERNSVINTNSNDEYYNDIRNSMTYRASSTVIESDYKGNRDDQFIESKKRINFSSDNDAKDIVNELDYIEEILVTNSSEFTDADKESKEYDDDTRLDELDDEAKVKFESISERVSNSKGSINKSSKARAPIIIENEPLLALATCILRGDFIEGQMNKVFAYIIFLIDFKMRQPGASIEYDLSEVSIQFDELYSVILTELTKPPKISHKLREDIAYISAWLSRYPIESANKVYKSLRNKITRIKTVNLSNTIPNIEIYGKTLDIDEYIRTKKGDKDSKVGDIFKELIIDDDVSKDRDILKKFLNDRIKDNAYYNVLAQSGYSNLIDQGGTVVDITEPLNEEFRGFGTISFNDLEGKDLVEMAQLIIDGKLDPAVLGESLFNDVELEAYGSHLSDQWDEIALKLNLPWC